ncbi:unnamed protein product [Cylindrotheca closterium]|uniref:FAD/NAD(P)-binding domain-containing protein n=1 Tax=Cylindrotheca closterium TaxID=2856 RepID=A0AAD2GDT9_9STRA|nr:unnamed protein product [Cylindrotheca closterium]
MSHSKHLVLVGGGHAHAQVIKALNKASRSKDLKVTLIDSQKSASYSGMVPGCVAGAYTAEDTLLHLEPLSSWAGIDFINDQVVDIDFERKEIVLKSNEDPVSFDAVSLDIGSASRGLKTTKGALENTIPTRPISDLVKRFDAETQKLRAGDSSAKIHVVMIGGGPAGIELSMSVMGRWKPIVGKDNIRVTVLNAGSELVSSETDLNRQTLVAAMEERGIEVRQESYVQEVKPNCVVLESGEEISCTHCLWATGAESHSLAFQLGDRGLAVSDRGYIRVNQYLQSVSHPFVFAAGDCNVIEGLSKPSPPKAGVFAVRSGPILVENLPKCLTGKTTKESNDLTAYVPQDDFLKLLVCGDGTAIGFRFGFPIQGKWVFDLKDAIDRSFVNLFKEENLPELEDGKPYDNSQYDATADRRPPLDPTDAAEIWRRTDDDLNYEEAWDVIRDMAADEQYKNSVLEILADRFGA